MSELLYDTNELEVFSTPVMGMWVRGRWREARCFYACDGFLLLVSLLLLLLHTGWIQDARILLPLVIIQIWMLAVEMTDIIEKKGGYFT